MVHEGLLIHGYQQQSTSAVDTVNENKLMEERLLRRLDQFMNENDKDKRWLSIARTHFEEGFMAMNRAVFQPKRVELPNEENNRE